jgi:hypothetical protein
MVPVRSAGTVGWRKIFCGLLFGGALHLMALTHF